MEHESFEDEEIASVMNEHFVNVKVDREERPDVDGDLHDGGAGDDRARRLADDRVPDGGPAPVLRRHVLPARAAHGCRRSGRSSSAVPTRTGARREEVRARARSLERVGRTRAGRAPAATPAARHCSSAPSAALARRVRRRANTAASAARRSSRSPWRSTSCCATTAHRRPTDALRHGDAHPASHGRGGIYDQLGGGFHRYSVDAHWLVPHFEKMLYDNALLARLYLHAWQATSGSRSCARRPPDARLRPARDDDARRRLLLRSGRGQ
jgi:uncharacterized protein